MIAYLKGHVEEIREDAVILDVNNIGYRVEASSTTLDQVRDAGSEIKLLIYHHFTDSDQRLFGFFTRNEKNLFEKLITVKGVGPKSGLNILSGLPADQLIRAITGSQASTLSKVPGIGKKTAERIIVELKDKLDAPETESGGQPLVGGGVTDEAISALESLGFKKREAEAAVLKALKDSDSSNASEVIKKSLSLLNK
ncbi:Holliday junction branch migration protein RuvA [Balneola sp. MJW-20]|uniref:Holliday junction branch migration protein RuvA n=1 Tax=Gracilimonas aurantiaca TaxID=3234185 RepID=UPI00346518A0